MNKAVDTYWLDHGKAELVLNPRALGGLLEVEVIGNRLYLKHTYYVAAREALA